MLALKKMRSGKGQLELVDCPPPRPASRQVVIEVMVAGICGTDLHIIQDEFPTNPPVTLGHEVAGRVVEIGEGVQGWSTGDRVVTETYFSTCQVCLHCRTGRPNLCAQRKSIGSAVDGGFAQYVVVPAANLHKLPSDLPWTTAVMTEPLACAVYGVGRTRITPGEWVVVSGPGPIGLLATQVARLSGGNVIVTGLSHDVARLEMARELGATHVMDVQSIGHEKATQVIHEITGGGASVVIECAGAGPSSSFLLDAVRKGGRYGQIGLFGKTVALNFDTVCYKELTVTGTNASVPEAWPRALALLKDGFVRTGPMITGVWHLQHWREAFDAALQRLVVKAMLTCQGEVVTK